MFIQLADSPVLMYQPPSEVIFSLAPPAGDKTSEPCVFRYDHGAMKLRAPKKRGRPRGCMYDMDQLGLYCVFSS